MPRTRDRSCRRIPTPQLTPSSARGLHPRGDHCVCLLSANFPRQGMRQRKSSLPSHLFLLLFSLSLSLSRAQRCCAGSRAMRGVIAGALTPESIFPLGSESAPAALCNPPFLRPSRYHPCLSLSLSLSFSLALSLSSVLAHGSRCVTRNGSERGSRKVATAAETPPSPPLPARNH